MKKEQYIAPTTSSRTLQLTCMLLTGSPEIDANTPPMEGGEEGEDFAKKEFSFDEDPFSVDSWSD